jgi:hypothetical protein
MTRARARGRTTDNAASWWDDDDDDVTAVRDATTRHGTDGEYIYIPTTLHASLEE